METVASQTTKSSLLGDVHLLLVEDSPDQVELIRRAFQRTFPKIPITWVDNGQAAIELLAERSFTLILLDYGLPRMTGLETLIKIQERGNDIPVVVITGQGDERVAVETMKMGAYDYIIKTHDYLSTLPSVVERVIEQHRVKARLIESQEAYRILNEVSLSISVELNVETLLQKMVDGACRMVQAEMGTILLIDPKTRKVVLLKTSGVAFDAMFLEGKLDAWGIFDRLFKDRQPYATSSSDEIGTMLPPHSPAMLEVVVVPLLKHGEVKGFLLVANKVSGLPFEREESNLLFTLALYASTALENAQLLQETKVLAITDSLTGLYNHREFQRKLQEEVERSRRYEHEFSLLMMDIDHFKSLNDTYGHQVGDAILKAVGRLIQEEVRMVNISARYGGEEFAIVLPETSLRNAFLVAERVRKKIFTNRFVLADDRETMVTVSIGVAAYPSDGENREGLIYAADQSLYMAKEAGRNFVYCYSDGLRSRNKTEVNPDQYRDSDSMGNDMVTTRTAKGLGGHLGEVGVHVEQVSRYAMLLAKAVGIDDRGVESLRVAGLLHDIGILAIPDRILSKIEELTQEEREIIKFHPGMSEMILRKAGQLQDVLPAILHHHERFDGKGYPDGLKGERIPLLARILGVVDAYQAMVSLRSYREPPSYSEILEELKRNAGTQFDPKLIELFIQLLEENKQ